ALEDSFAVLFANPDAVVLDFDRDAAVRAPRAQHDVFVGSGELHRVVQQVQDYLRHGVAVDGHRRETWFDVRFVRGAELLRAEYLADVADHSFHRGRFAAEQP